MLSRSRGEKCGRDDLQLLLMSSCVARTACCACCADAQDRQDVQLPSAQGITVVNIAYAPACIYVQRNMQQIACAGRGQVHCDVRQCSGIWWCRRPHTHLRSLRESSERPSAVQCDAHVFSFSQLTGHSVPLLQKGRDLGYLMNPGDGAVTALAFHHAAAAAVPSYLLNGSSDGSVSVWQASSSKTRPLEQDSPSKRHGGML